MRRNYWQELLTHDVSSRVLLHRGCCTDFCCTEFTLPIVDSDTTCVSPHLWCMQQVPTVVSDFLRHLSEAARRKVWMASLASTAAVPLASQKAAQRTPSHALWCSSGGRLNVWLVRQ